jgi:hypothetical protein
MSVDVITDCNLTEFQTFLGCGTSEDSILLLETGDFFTTEDDNNLILE